MVENRKVSIGTLAFDTTQRVEVDAAASSGDGVSHAFGDLLKFGFGLGHGSVTSGSQQRVTAVGDFGGDEMLGDFKGSFGGVRPAVLLAA